MISNINMYDIIIKLSLQEEDLEEIITKYGKEITVFARKMQPCFPNIYMSNKKYYLRLIRI